MVNALPASGGAPASKAKYTQAQLNALAASGHPNGTGLSPAQVTSILKNYMGATPAPSTKKTTTTTKPTAKTATTKAPTAKAPAAKAPAAAAKAAPLNAAALAAKYGYAAAFFNTNTELKNLIATATKEQWTAEEFQARFQNTNWYRQSTESAKKDAALRASNPAQYWQERKNMELQIYDQARQNGITIPQDRLSTMAALAYRDGWTPAQMNRAIAAEQTWDGQANEGGQVGATEDMVKEAAAAYGIQMDPAQIEDFARRMLIGDLTTDGITNWVKTQAKSKYPGLTAQIDSGLTVKDVASPYMAEMSNILELPSNSIDWTKDTTIQKALQSTDGTSGQQAQMPIWQFQQTLKQDPRWMQTNNARESMTSVGSKVLKDMGLLA